MDSEKRDEVLRAFKTLIQQIKDIDQRTATEYPQIKLLGRDCYLWKGYVVKSSPNKWNFKTNHELKILKYLNLKDNSNYFPELITDVTVGNRVFLLLRYFPVPNLSMMFYKYRWQKYKLFPGAIRNIEREGKIILNKLLGLGIIHRDITPENLLYDFWRHHLILIDFGFAVHEGEKIQTDIPETKELLEDILQHHLGGNYRKPGIEFSYETDKYSFEMIIKELKQMSFWSRL